ncbi:MAG: hypothetical protein ACM3ZT_08665 [Bacillota bacterium]
MGLSKKFRLLSAALLAAGAVIADSPVSESRNYRVNLFPESAPVYIALKVQGDSFQDPFKWTMTITDIAGKALLQVSGDDAAIDKNFGDDAYVGGCKGYDACKRKWYLEDLPKTIPNSAHFVPKGEGMALPQWHVDAIKKRAGDFLKTKGLSEGDRADAVQEILQLLNQGGYAVFSPVDGPRSEGTVYMYVPSLGYFVPCDQD